MAPVGTRPEVPARARQRFNARVIQPARRPVAAPDGQILLPRCRWPTACRTV